MTHTLPLLACQTEVTAGMEVEITVQSNSFSPRYSAGDKLRGIITHQVSDELMAAMRDRLRRSV